MFETSMLESRLSPLGYRCKVKVDENDTKFTIFSITCTGVNQKNNHVSEEVYVCIPKLDETYGRIIEVEGSSGTRYRVIAHQGFQNLLSETLVSDISVVHWQLTVIDALNTIISDALLDVHFDGSKPFKDNASQRFQNWLNTANHILDVDPDNPMKVKSACEAIMINIQDEMMSHNSRIYDKQWLGKIDPTSTPTSEKINVVYRMAKGAKVEFGKIVNGDSIFCSSVSDNAIATSLNPRRGYLLRTTFENSVKLLNPEEPRIKPRENHLDGVHLSTAIMHYGVNTFEDAILVSKSAATKLACHVSKRITFRSRSEITKKVAIGDVVAPGQILAHSADEELNVRANKLIRSAEVAEIEEYQVVHHNYIHNAIRFTLHNIYALEPGDKISNRGAGKGVVNIVHDHAMPRREDGSYVEVCCAPEALAGRRVMSLYWEMMAHKAQYDDVEINPELGNPSPSFKTLAQDYGNKEQLYIGERPLPDKTFVGDIFWIRINKHACEMNSAVGSKRILNSNRVLVDDARISGQRIDVAKTMAFHDKGLLKVLEHAIKGSPFGPDVVREYVDSLVPINEELEHVTN